MFLVLSFLHVYHLHLQFFGIFVFKFFLAYWCDFVKNLDIYNAYDMLFLRSL